MIGIICAESQEMAEVLHLMENKSTEQVASFNFIKGSISYQDCVTVLCGIGKVHAAICSQTLFLRFHPDILLNIGVAGGIGYKTKIGDIVIADYVVQHDFDVSACSERPKGEIPGLDLIKIPCTSWVTKKILESAKNINIKTHIGTILTGDQFVNNAEILNSVADDFNGVACDMESGSIGQVCYINNINFGIIRAISDNTDKNSNTDFYKFIQDSSKKATHILHNFISSY